MHEKPIRVLQVVGRMDCGGIETMIMNLYRNIDREQVQFDFLAHFGREAAYNEEIRALGGRIYEMPALRDENHVFFWQFFAYLRALHHFFLAHREYRVIHGHMTHTAALYMPFAKRYGVSCRIVHSHSTRSKGGLLGVLTTFLHRFASRDATDFFACSEAAKSWFFPKKIISSGTIHLLANAVDAKRFRFDPEKRSAMRRALHVEGKVVIGCVGRFRQEKNQEFLLGVLEAMIKKEENVVLLFVGDGPLEQAVRGRAQAMRLMEHVQFLGMRTDVHDLMQAMDAFALPSVWEGLPVAGIEAQASGLHGVASDGVSPEVDALRMVERIPLSSGDARWADALLRAARQPRRDTYAQLCAAGYDIHTTAPWLQAFYMSKAK